MKRQLFLAAIFFISFPYYKVAASTDIATSVNVNYAITEAGQAQATYHISLVNQSASTYVTQYTLELPSNRIKDIKAFNEKEEPLTFTSTTTDTSTVILFNLKDPIVGKNKQNVIKLTYINPDISQKVGNILEINLPKVDDTHQYTSYTAQVIVPATFGTPSLISPQTHIQENDTTLTRIKFNQESLQQGALILFGNEQYYRLTTGIKLENPSITPIETQFALPPDTPYQKVFINNLNPSPKNLKTDADGNWLATYQLEAKQALPIYMDFSFIIYNRPAHSINNQDLDLNQFTAPQKFWETTDAKVKELTPTLTTSQDIYTYLLNNFQYDYSRLDNQSTHRLGVGQALLNPKNSLCLEFSDTFITLARSQGIPARLLTGYAYTQNPNRKPLSLVQNTLHAWPEYYDLETTSWRAIDPTWGHTTSGIDYFHSFDFNHIVFAINGLDSESPEPLGLSPSSPENLKVTVLDQKPEARIHLTPHLKTPWTTKLGLTHNLELILENTSNTALYNETITLSANGIPFHSEVIKSSLPSSTSTHKLQLTSLPKHTNTITLSLYGQTNTATLNRPPAFTGLLIFALTTTVAAALAIITYHRRSLLVSRERK